MRAPDHVEAEGVNHEPPGHSPPWSTTRTVTEGMLRASGLSPTVTCLQSDCESIYNTRARQDARSTIRS